MPALSQKFKNRAVNGSATQHCKEVGCSYPLRAPAIRQYSDTNNITNLKILSRVKISQRQEQPISWFIIRQNLILPESLQGSEPALNQSHETDFIISPIDINDYGQGIFVTGDGDFYCLVKYLEEKGKLGIVLAPSAKNCSSLLRRVAKKKIALVSDLRNKIEYKKRTS